MTTAPEPTVYYKFTSTPAQGYSGPQEHQSHPSHDPTTQLTAVFKHTITRNEYYNLDLATDRRLFARGRNGVVYLCGCPWKLGCSTARIRREFERAVPGCRVRVRSGGRKWVERYEECVAEAVDGLMRDGVLVDSGARSVGEGIGEMLVIPYTDVEEGVEMLGLIIGDQEYEFEVLGKVVDGDVEFRKSAEELRPFFGMQGSRCWLKMLFQDPGLASNGDEKTAGASEK